MSDSIDLLTIQQMNDMEIVNCLGMAKLPTIVSLLHERYNGEVQFIDIGGDCMIRYGENNIANMSYLPVILQFLKIEDGLLTLEGNISLPACYENRSRFYVEVCGREIPFRMYDAGFDVEEGAYIEKRTAFCIRLELDNLPKEGFDFTFGYDTDGIKSVCSKINSLRFFPVADLLEEQYAVLDCWMFQIKNGCLIAKPVTQKKQEEAEKQFLDCLRNKHPEWAVNVEKIRKEIFVRRQDKKKKIWLFFDRLDKADDNGEAMFRFLCTKKPSDIDYYFVIGENSPDYERMKTFGPVVPALSFEHQVLLSVADYVVTSQLNGYVENPYGETEECFRDLYHRAKVVFLQHGVTKDNQTKWLNRFNQDLYGLVAAAPMEYQSFLETPYFYDTNTIWYTGMPRFDLMEDKTEKYILVMPTWRQKYMKQVLLEETQTYKWFPNEEFDDSSYIKVYNSLLCNEKFKKMCKRKGYRIIFMPHPIVQPYVDRFKAPEDVIVFNYNVSWRDLFEKCALMITDYSSVAFDFAYLNKPVLYYQFDRDEFFSSHSYKEGYFDYKDMGFGEVVSEEAELLNCLEYYLNTNCKSRQKYLDRIKDFFGYQDRNNSQRIYERILEMEKIGKIGHSNYEVSIIEGHIVHIVHKLPDGGFEDWNIYLENVFWGGNISFPMTVEDDAVDTIIYMHDLTEEEFATTGEYRAKGPSTGTIRICANDNRKAMHFVMYTSREQHYSQLVKFRHRNEHVALTKENLLLDFEGCLYTKYAHSMDIKKVELVIDANHRQIIPIHMQLGREEYEKVDYSVPISSIIEQETDVNNAIHIEVYFDEETFVSFNIGHKTDVEMPKKFYYVPITSGYYGDYALCVRGNVHQNYSLVVRPKDPIEYDKSFLFKESELVSKFLYHVVGKLKVLRKKKPVNLFFEKNSMKADEGTFEIFDACCKLNSSKSYFILDEHSAQWPELSKHKNVVKKYSWKYYFLLYSANNFISTETSSHLNVHRAINPYVRRTLLESNLIFLQHGVTYLKCQGGGSVFGKDKEGEPTIIAVGSQKEAKVVAKMLHIPIERCMIAGLPVFSTIEADHITESSEDIATIMLTWKVSEEHLLTHFEDSTYFQYVCEVYDLLKQHLPEKQIRIVPHPKVLEHLAGTRLGDTIWTGAVSDALRDSKLLITDYSSTCYNSFYQGGAVVFYQPDLEKFQKEVGKLIPQDDEYIGYRVFEKEDLKEVIDAGIHDGHIDLGCLRNEEFVARYQTINEFNDGKNIDRIVDYLKKKNIV